MILIYFFSLIITRQDTCIFDSRSRVASMFIFLVIEFSRGFLFPACALLYSTWLPFQPSNSKYSRLILVQSSSDAIAMRLGISDLGVASRPNFMTRFTVHVCTQTRCKLDIDFASSIRERGARARPTARARAYKCNICTLHNHTRTQTRVYAAWHVHPLRRRS